MGHWIQYGWISQRYCWTKQVRHEREAVIWFNLYKVQNHAKPIYGNRNQMGYYSCLYRDYKKAY